ncbi:FHA domain-containing protein, partial [Candidatus Gracilibacteria bacterium]|nr:FHA domain-containing protein [Candidatus Gracilibacteria bacterium]
MRDGDLLRVGRVTLRFKSSAEAESAPTVFAESEALNARLVGAGGSLEGRIFTLERLDVTIGRDPSNDIVLDVPIVSRHHADIQFDGIAFYLSDAGSQNGTWLDETRVLGASPCSTGRRSAWASSSCALNARRLFMFKQISHPRRWSLVLAGVFVIVATSCWAPSVVVAAAPQLDIVAVDATAYPELDITVSVRDQYSQGVQGLTAASFIVEEQGLVLPQEALQVTPMNALPTPVTIALVADMSAFIGEAALTAIRSDIQTLLEAILRDEGPMAEIGLFVPRGSQTDLEAPIAVQPFTNDSAGLLYALAQVGARKGQTDLYNTVVTAIGASVDHARQRGGAAYVVVFGDGIDNTSIVGSGSLGANEAARIAEDQGVRIFALGYGDDVDRGGPLLSQLTARTGGSFQAKPDAAGLSELAQHVRTGATQGTYRVRFSTATPADGTQHTLVLRAQLDSGHGQHRDPVFCAAPWDATTLSQLDVEIDTEAYPQVTLWAHPINALRRTVPGLDAQDFSVLLDNAPLPVALTVDEVPLAGDETPDLPSVALVFVPQGDDIQTLRDITSALLQAPALQQSRMALFVPGTATNGEQVSSDHNALLNALTQLVPSATAGSVGATLQRAISTVARDGDERQRPAHVVLLTNSALGTDDRIQTLARARDRGVSLHIVSSDAQFDSAELSSLADATDGTVLNEASAPAIEQLATQIAQAGLTRYRISFELALLADGTPRQLALAVGEQQTPITLTPLVAGAATINFPLSTLEQALIGVASLVLLLGAIVVVRKTTIRHLRCPSCGQVRRASWNKACLFCEHAASQRNASPAQALLDEVGLGLSDHALSRPALRRPAAARRH